MKKPVQTTIGDQSFNARHFSAMPEDKAIAAMKADGLASDDAFAKKAYAACVADVKKADEPPKEEKK
jgi:hypothetical protein